MIDKKQITPFLRVLAQLVFIILAHCCIASTLAYELRQSDRIVNPVDSIEVLEDPTQELSFEDVSQGSSAKNFKPANVSGSYLNFGFSTSAFWLKIPLSRAPQVHEDWLLKISYISLDEIDFYAPDRPVVKTGSALPVSSRPIFDPMFVFPLTLTSSSQNFYIRVISRSSISVPLDIFERNALIRTSQIESLTQAVYYGGLLALALYNFLMFFSLRDRSFLLYTVFALTTALGMFAGNGYARLYLWPDWNNWDQIAMIAIFSLSGTLNFLFSRSFLKTKIRNPKIDLALKFIAGLFFLLFIFLILSLHFSMSSGWLYQAIFILTLGSAPVLLYATLITIRAGHRDAYYFLWALSCLWIGACLASLRAFDLLPSNVFSSYALQIGSALEMLLFSFALANRIQFERDSRESVQLELNNARNVLLASLKQNEEQLEKTVLERTSELESLLKNEKNLREQYDRFGAMISHEFRNPLGIIESQAALVKREDAAGINNIEKRINVISSATHRLAMLFDKWLQSDRLTYATNSVRAEQINLSAWIEDLTDRCGAYHSNYFLELKLSDSAVQIWADEQLLQIAVLNLIDNACKYSAPQSRVRIETRIKPGMTGIAVIDQGCGIEPQFHEKIFIEYFRVNPQNTITGVGLGLPFVKRIVTLHGGEIELVSDVGLGSSFCIWLPDH